MARAKVAQEELRIADTLIAPGERRTINLRLPRLYTHTEMAMPVQVLRSRHSGPRLFVSAALHGDEINGVEIIRRVLKLPVLRRLRGTLIAVPVVNVYGFVSSSRYLPDRRDLNRNFPGSERGSLTARLANLFMKEVVRKCSHGIDLHTGAIHRSNLPQIRACLDFPATRELAVAFGTPVILNADIRDGSLREAVQELGMPMLLYEGGEALRFDEFAIRAGVWGVVSVMRTLGMLPRSRRRRPLPEPTVVRSTTWVRAPGSGILRAIRPLGARVAKGEVLGIIADPFGENEVEVTAPAAGLVIGRVNLPMVNEGEALFHLARFESIRSAAAAVEAFQTEMEGIEQIAPDEPPIV